MGHTNLSQLIFWVTIILAIRNTIAEKPDGKIYFDKVGETSFQSETVTIKIRLDIHQTWLLMNELKEALGKQRNLIRNDKNGELHQFEKHAFIENIGYKIFKAEALATRCKFFLDIQNPYFSESRVGHHRNKRAIFTVLAIIAAVAATAFAAYTVEELISIRQQAEAADQVLATAFDLAEADHTRQATLAGLVSSTAKQADNGNAVIWQLMLNDRIEATLDVAERQIRDIEAIITSALSQKLSPVAIETTDPKKVLLILAEKSLATGFKPLIRRPSDLLQCKTSFLMDERGFDLLVHVPTVPTESILELYRFIALPIPTHDKYHSVINVDDTILAINHDNSLYRTFSALELEQCRQIGYFYTCDRSNVVRIAPQSLADPMPQIVNTGACLFALFTQRFHDAAVVCDVIIQEAPDTVIQVSESKFLSYNKIAHQGLISCSVSESPVRETFPANNINELSLRPGCTATTATHIFSHPASGKIRDWTLTYDIPATLNWTAEINFDEFHKLRLQGELALTNASSFSAGEAVLAWRDNQRQKVGKPWSQWASTTTHPVFSTIIAIILMAIVCIISAFCIVKRCKQQRLSLANMPTAPPAYINVNTGPANRHIEVQPQSLSREERREFWTK